MVELTQYAGFSLQFDPESLQIQSGDGLSFRRITRLGRELKEMVCFPEEIKLDEPMYMMDILDSVSEEIQSVLNRFQLIYSLVLLPPRKIGQEFVKTAGHYHPPIPGTTLGYPEVYTQLYGKLLLILQRRSGTNPYKIMDYVVVEMTPGVSITIPPNFAHSVVNPTNGPALMAGLYGREFKPDYVLTRERHGLAYYLLSREDGKLSLAPNPNYPDRPEVRWLESLDDTYFAPDFPGQPVWSAFIQDPAAFAYLTVAQAATIKFPRWE